MNCFGTFPILNLILVFLRLIQLKGFVIDYRFLLAKSGRDLNVKESEINRYDTNDSQMRRAAVRERWRLWDEGVIPYSINPELRDTMRTLFFSAVREWESSTCLKFVPDDETHKSSIYVTNHGDCGCCSTLGRFSKKQTFVLSETSCESLSVILHELGHAIGFSHEQSRPDRDQYIKILYENVISGYESEFEKMSDEQVDSLGFGYDFNSIMHYGPTIFGKEGKLTMETVDNSSTIPLRNLHLSEIDIAQTIKLYNCPSCYTSVFDSKGTIKNSEEFSMEEKNYCQWFIKRKEEETIVFSLDYVDIPDNQDCSSDYVEIRDGYWSKSPIIGRFCGNQSVEDVYKSTSNTILVTYKRSSNISDNEGFSLNYIVSCGGKIEADKGILESEQILNYLHLTTNCVWIITVPLTYQVAINFESINMKYDENCTDEFVEILEGDGDDGESLGKFCGSALPKNILSNNNTVTVRMQSRKNETAKDFSLSFVKELNECDSPDKGGCSDICVNTIGGYYCKCEEGKSLFPDKKFCGTFLNDCGGTFNVTVQIIVTSPSFPANYPRMSSCTWEIANEDVQFTFIFLDTEKSKKKCKDKVIISASNISKKTFCGNRKPSSFNVTDAQDLKIDFLSDKSYQKKGFALLIEPL